PNSKPQFPNGYDFARHSYFNKVGGTAFSVSKIRIVESAKETSPLIFDQPGAVTVGCNIHEWMHGVILVLPTPYFAVTDASGVFALREVPAGRSSVAAWHEGAKAGVEATAQTVDVGPDTAPLTFTLTVAPRHAASGSGGLRSAE
ncbi:MAG: carboxypeptidase regulatory-like domain-containing protein, partial [bacterium]